MGADAAETLELILRLRGMLEEKRKPERSFALQRNTQGHFIAEIEEACTSRDHRDMVCDNGNNIYDCLKLNQPC